MNKPLKLGNMMKGRTCKVKHHDYFLTPFASMATLKSHNGFTSKTFMILLLSIVIPCLFLFPVIAPYFSLTRDSAFENLIEELNTAVIKTNQQQRQEKRQLNDHILFKDQKIRMKNGYPSVKDIHLALSSLHNFKQDGTGGFHWGHQNHNDQGQCSIWYQPSDSFETPKIKVFQDGCFNTPEWILPLSLLMQKKDSSDLSDLPSEEENVDKQLIEMLKAS